VLWTRRLLARAVVSVGLACAAMSAVAASVGEPVMLPAVTLLDGTKVSAAQLTGKPVVVVFWASWCPYCAKHNPGVQKLVEAAKGTDLQVLTVTIDKDLSAARKYLAGKPYTFAATADVAAMEKALGSRRALPKTYVIDRTGKLAVFEAGEMFEEDLVAFKRFGLPVQ
jgi:thiol-disulfide isomerase/thioredoxin